MADPAARPASSRPPVLTLAPGSSSYPSRLLHAAAPPPLQAIGLPGILQGTVLGLVCSVRLPGRIMLEAYEWARQMKHSRVVVAGGFHSPMERVCFQQMLRGQTRLVYCPARGIARLRVPAAWRPPIVAGRLLILSAVEDPLRRATRALAARRNRFVVALADALLIPYAGRGTATEFLALAATRLGTPLYTFPGPENENLLQMGARAWGMDPTEF
ncbi:MAG TPA: DNA-processing protein DprA [Bacteroidota bacterium]